MKITLIYVGKTVEKYLEEGIRNYVKRLAHYCKFQIIVIPDIKNSKSLSEGQIKLKESEGILRNIKSGETVILLDEKGKEYNSVAFASWIERLSIQSVQHLVFVIGGPYGFDQTVHERADGKMSLSKMTFSHQMVRLFFVEQLYRGFTIIKGEPYHHE